MDKLFTIIGGGGFIGRYVVQELAKTGVRLRVTTRSRPESLYFLQPLGQLGQIEIVKQDDFSCDSLSRLLQDSDGVVNLIGILEEKGKNSFEAIHAETAACIAQAAQAVGVKRLTHVSALGADTQSPSLYHQSKARGEKHVRHYFPDATIVRPSAVFGTEDQFVNRLARLIHAMPLVSPVIAPDWRLQPVYVVDVAKTVVATLCDSPLSTGKPKAKLLELGGPDVWTMHDLTAWISQAIGCHKPLLDIPDSLASPLVALFGGLPGSPLTKEQWTLTRKDNVLTGDNGLTVMDVPPTPLQIAEDSYLVRYRPQGRWA